MRAAAFLAVLALGLLAGGCGSLAAPSMSTSMAPPPPKAPSAAEELVAYLSRLRSLDEAALASEAARQREFDRQEPGELNRLKVALALAVAPQTEEADIIALVEPLAKETQGTDPDVRAMASFLQGIAVERRRLKESAAAAGARSRDEKKAFESQKQRADTLQERNAQLQQKLDALTDLEKSLSIRKGN